MAKEQKDPSNNGGIKCDDHMLSSDSLHLRPREHYINA